MAIIIKTKEEIEKIREAGKRLARMMQKVSEKVVPGISTWELDAYGESLIREMGDIPALKGFQPEGATFPFPATLCISINEEVVHGIPSRDRILKDGDIVSLDCVIKHDRFFADTAITVPVGNNVNKRVLELLEDTQKALEMGIAAAQTGFHVGDIGYAVSQYAKTGGRNYGVVRILAGHGVGKHIHEEPFIPNFGKAGKGPQLVPGMIIAIEPMFNMGTEEVLMMEDGYTFITQDKKWSAHFEHTVLITEDGPEILTM